MIVVTIRKNPWAIATYTNVTSVTYNGTNVSIFVSGSQTATVTVPANDYLVRIMSNDTAG